MMKTQIIDLLNPLWQETLQQLRHDIYHLPCYLDLEAKRSQSTPEAVLIIDEEKIFFLPYLLRNCDNLFPAELNKEKFFDIVSPYGYPGILLNKAAASTPDFLTLAMNELKSVLKSRCVCSAFFRLHPILNDGFENILSPENFQITGETVSIDLTLSETEIWQETHKDQRKNINRCKKAGFTARMVPFKPYIDEFVEIYQETMERVEAAKYYYTFSNEYYSQLADILGEKIKICLVELNAEIACAGLYTECCGIVQSVLGGTRTKFLKQSPYSLNYDYARFWAKESGDEVFHMGGGVGGSNDGVYNFKTSFSKQRHNFLTMRLIIDEEKYRYLVELRAKSLNTQAENLLNRKFFPAYRSLEV